MHNSIEWDQLAAFFPEMLAYRFKGAECVFLAFVLAALGHEEDGRTP